MSTAIKNVIFDMGNVLKKFDKRACVDPYVRDAADADLLSRVCLESDEWVELDRGTLTFDEAGIVWKTRLPERLYCAVDMFVDYWDFSMTDLPNTTWLVGALAEKGYDVYLLSNVSTRFERIKKSFPALRYMNGIVTSAEERLLKPDRRIYEVLLKRYSLSADECVFIDDAPANTDGARAVGMNAITYDGDFDKLVFELCRLGIEI